VAGAESFDATARNTVERCDRSGPRSSGL